MYVQLSGLEKSFGSQKVVKDLNLSLEKGKILCLLGASGCGKTTTLRMIGGFLESDSGTIEIDGENITDLPPEGRPISTVFQSYALFPHMNVIDNVIYGLKFRGLRKKEAVELGRKYLDIVGLTQYERSRIYELSGGQQQRVAVARALAVSPKLLLMDEPFSNLDARLRVRMREEMRQLQQDLGMTMIFVTHDQEEAMVLGDQIAIMNQGRLVQTGSAQEIYNHPEDDFVMNFLGIANRLIMPDGSVIHVRPEAIEIATEGNLPGTILKMEFLGFYYQYQIKTPGGIATVRCGPTHHYLPGENVRLRVNREAELLRENQEEEIKKL